MATTVSLERFRAKACPGLDPGWPPVRVKKTRQNKKQEAPFRFNRNGKGSRTVTEATMADTPEIEPLILCPDCKLEMRLFGTESESPIRDLYTFVH
jgi:hypothetical protein